MKLKIVSWIENMSILFLSNNWFIINLEIGSSFNVTRHEVINDLNWDQHSGAVIMF